MTTLLFTSIGRRGYIADYFRAASCGDVRIIGTSCIPETVGFAACDEAYLVPPVCDAGYIETVLNICRKERVDALFSFLDVDVERLAAHRNDFLAAGVTPVIPESDVCERFLDKAKMAGFLEEKGFPSVRTYAALDEVLAAIGAGDLDFPLCLKGRRGFGSNGLYFPKTLADLKVFWSECEEPVAQAFVDGTEYNLDLLHDLDGNYLIGNVKKKLLMRGGETDQSVTVSDSRLQAFCDDFGRSFAGIGPSDVDIIDSGTACYVIDVNPRFGGGYPGAHVAGADHPGLLLDLIEGKEIDIARGRAEPGVLMMKGYDVVGMSHADLLKKIVKS